MPGLSGANRMRISLALSAVVFGAVLAAHAACAAPSLDAMRHMLAGTWQSTNDARFTRELDADGTAIDRYKGDASATDKGTWMLFPGSAPPPDAKDKTLTPTSTYLEIKEGDDALFFEIDSVSPKALSMFYIERGNRLAFIRAK